MEDPDLAITGPGDTIDAALEDAGSAGWGDGLTGGDDAGVGYGAGGLIQGLTQQGER